MDLEMIKTKSKHKRKKNKLKPKHSQEENIAESQSVIVVEEQPEKLSERVSSPDLIEESNCNQDQDEKSSVAAKLESDTTVIADNECASVEAETKINVTSSLQESNETSTGETVKTHHEKVPQERTYVLPGKSISTPVITVTTKASHANIKSDHENIPNILETAITNDIVESAIGNDIIETAIENDVETAIENDTVETAIENDTVETAIVKDFIVETALVKDIVEAAIENEEKNLQTNEKLASGQTKEERTQECKLIEDRTVCAVIPKTTKLYADLPLISIIKYKITEPEENSDISSSSTKYSVTTNKSSEREYFKQPSNLLKPLLARATTTASDSARDKHEKVNIPFLKPQALEQPKQVLLNPRLSANNIPEIKPFITEYCKKYFPPVVPSKNRDLTDEKIPLRVTWTDLTEKFDLELIDDLDDEAITNIEYYNMILREDLLPDRTKISSGKLMQTPSGHTLYGELRNASDSMKNLYSDVSLLNRSELSPISYTCNQFGNSCGQTQDQSQYDYSFYSSGMESYALRDRCDNYKRDHCSGLMTPENKGKSLKPTPKLLSHFTMIRTKTKQIISRAKNVLKSAFTFTNNNRSSKNKKAEGTSPPSSRGPLEIDAIAKFSPVVKCNPANHVRHEESKGHPESNPTSSPEVNQPNNLDWLNDYYENVSLDSIDEIELFFQSLEEEEERKRRSKTNANNSSGFNINN